MTSINFFYVTIKIISFMLATSFGLSHSKLDKPFLTSLKVICNNTLYPNICYDSLSPLIASNQKNYDSEFLYNISVQVAIDEIATVYDSFNKHTFLESALESCSEALSLALYNLYSALTTNGITLKTRETRTNFTTLLSAAGAKLQKCKDGFEYAPNEVLKLAIMYLDKSTKLVTTSLNIITKIDDDYMSTSYQEPPFVDTALDTSSNELTSENRKTILKSRQAVQADAVVAEDGSGKYKTIAEAINVVPPNSNKRFAIYVKKGVYNENVIVETNKWNVLIYGDGMLNTIVSSNLSNTTGSSTVSSATFAAYGKGFIAKDIGFQNTAGPDNSQAVALLSGSDQSVFYRCMLDGYQDTLYAQSNRQFYRECKIYGTVDFIFGNAAVVIQNSDILVRRPSNSNSNTTVVTAQGKLDPNTKTGISIQKCLITAAENLGGVETFLGRPWGTYSAVAVMQSQLGSLIDPKGWLPWDKNVTIPDTTFYVEYNNLGPGAATNARVRWNGLSINEVGKAKKFTVRSLISGDQWLPSTGVPFQADL